MYHIYSVWGCLLLPPGRHPSRRRRCRQDGDLHAPMGRPARDTMLCAMFAHNCLNEHVICVSVSFFPLEWCGRAGKSRRRPDPDQIMLGQVCGSSMYYRCGSCDVVRPHLRRLDCVCNRRGPRIKFCRRGCSQSVYRLKGHRCWRAQLSSELCSTTPFRSCCGRSVVCLV